MKKIIVHNGYSKLSEVSKYELELVKKALTYKDSTIVYLKRRDPKKQAWSEFKCLLDLRENKFPTGLIPNVVAVIPDILIEDKRVKPTQCVWYQLNQDIPELRYYQKDAVACCDTSSPNTLCLATGTGKTNVMINVINKMGLRVLVIVPGITLLEQTYQDLVYAFGKRYVSKDKEDRKEITILNMQSLRNLNKEWFSYFQATIVDEAHVSANGTFTDLNKDRFNDIYYRIGLTGTDYRNNGDDLVLRGFIGPTIYNYTPVQGISDGFLTRPEFVIIKIDNFTRYGYEKDYQSVYDTFIVKNKLRNQIIANLCKDMPNDSKIILVERIDHIELLKALIPDALVITGEEKPKERSKILLKFNMGECKTILATSGCLSTGVDLPIANVLINATAMKARSLIVQKVGRVLRKYKGKEYALIFDFFDANIPILEYHSKRRMVVYRSYKTKMELID